MPLFFEQVNGFILKFGDPYGPLFTNRWSDSSSAPGSSTITTNPATDAIRSTPPSPPTSKTLQGRDDYPPDLLPSPHNQPTHSSVDPFGSAASADDVLQGTEDGATSPGSFGPQTKAPAEYLPIPDAPLHSASPAPPSDGLLEGRISSAISPSPAHASQGILEGAKDFKIENSVLTNVQGNAMIFRFDSGSPPGEEFKSVLVKHMAGFVTVRDLDTIEKHTLSQAIWDLPRAEAAYDDYLPKDRRRVACFEGTRQALLEEIAQCVAISNGIRAYLLFGIAGIGKSTIAQTVSERADKLRILGASFFFSRDEAGCRNAKKFFTTIAFQLCAYDADFAQAIGTALIKEQGAAATSKDPQRQLKALILEPLQAIAKSRTLPTVIVVDALDECDAEDAPAVLMALDQLVQALPFFKVILTTRPQPYLQDILDLLGAHQLFQMEDIEGKIVEHDIRLYLQYHLSLDQVHARLPRLRQEWAASDEEINALVRAAGVLFIIASTAVLYILDAVACNPASRMKTLQDEFARNRTPFNTLNKFYTVILQSAVPLSCERDIVERYQAVVGTIVLIEDPLPVGALANLINMPENDIRYVLDNLQSVISLGNNDVPLVYHKSFPDYIIDDQRCRDANLCITPKYHHTRLAICCLQIMNKHLKRNILGLSGLAHYFQNKSNLKQKENDVQHAIPSELRYACIHWARHVVQADLEDGHLATELKMFAEIHLLHWLETLSWIRKIDTAPLSLGVIMKYQITDSDMHCAFRDAFRFVSRDYERIEESALYIYRSALAFTPTESLLYKNYHHESLLCQVIGGPAQWDAQISKNNNSVHTNHITFAKDSSWFASCGDYAVKLWDATSGTPLRTFAGNRIALADNHSVFATAQDLSVTLHSGSSRAPIASFDHPAEVIKMAISFNGSQLAAGLKGGIVRVWDVATKASIASLDGYDDRYDGCQLAFSPNGCMLAFTSKDGISLLHGGDVVRRLECGAEEIVSFTFFGDSTRLVTLIQEGNMYSLSLWNGKNGEFMGVARKVGPTLAVSADGSLVATGWDEVQLLSGDSLSLVDTVFNERDEIASLAFSESGDMLAIGSWETHAVTLYDIKNRASLAKLWIREPTSLAFSPDSTRLAAGGKNGALFLWDVPSIRVSALTPKKQLSPVFALSFSLDCSRLASGRSDGCVELWDTSDMGQPIACHRLHSEYITALAFSPDGDQLASGSEDTMVSLWDCKGGMQLGVLEHSFPGSPTSLAFSSSLLAIATVKCITLWDRTSLHLIHTFEQGSYLLSFSLNSSMLATSYHHNSQSKVVVLDTEKLVVTTTFTVEGDVTMLWLSPDGSQITAQRGYSHTSNHHGFKCFDVVNKTGISHPTKKDFTWVPHLNGIPILRSKNILGGSFSAQYPWVSMVQIPPDFKVYSFASQSSMFALGSKDGNILLIQPPPSH